MNVFASGCDLAQKSVKDSVRVKVHLKGYAVRKSAILGLHRASKTGPGVRTILVTRYLFVVWTCD